MGLDILGTTRQLMKYKLTSNYILMLRIQVIPYVKKQSKPWIPTKLYLPSILCSLSPPPGFVPCDIYKWEKMGNMNQKVVQRSNTLLFGVVPGLLSVVLSVVSSGERGHLGKCSDYETFDNFCNGGCELLIQSESLIPTTPVRKYLTHNMNYYKYMYSVLTKGIFFLFVGIYGHIGRGDT